MHRNNIRLVDIFYLVCLLISDWLTFKFMHIINVWLVDILFILVPLRYTNLVYAYDVRPFGYCLLYLWLQSRADSDVAYDLLSRPHEKNINDIILIMLLRRTVNTISITGPYILIVHLRSRTLINLL